MLGRDVIGRVIYTAGAMPTARPMKYPWFGGGGHLPDRGGQLAAATNNAVVAFEVDDVDIATRGLWACWRSGPG